MMQCTMGASMGVGNTLDSDGQRCYDLRLSHALVVPMSYQNPVSPPERRLRRVLEQPARGPVQGESDPLLFMTYPWTTFDWRPHLHQAAMWLVACVSLGGAGWALGQAWLTKLAGWGLLGVASLILVIEARRAAGLVILAWKKHRHQRAWVFSFDTELNVMLKEIVARDADWEAAIGAWMQHPRSKNELLVLKQTATALVIALRIKEQAAEGYGIVTQTSWHQAFRRVQDKAELDALLPAGMAMTTRKRI